MKIFPRLIFAYLFLIANKNAFVESTNGETRGQTTQRTEAQDAVKKVREVREKHYSSRERIEQMIQYSTLGQSFKPFVKKLLLSKADADFLISSILATVHWEDIILIGMVGWLTVPLFQLPYERLHFSAISFSKTRLHLVADHLQQIARIALAIYLVDILKMTCIGMGFDFCKMEKFPHAFAQSAYTFWIANRIARFKKHLLRLQVNEHPETYGRMQIINRLLNAAIYGFAFFVILNILQVQMGVAMNSVLAFGSAGTIALGLASKGITTQVLNGLMLASSDRIYEGDSVQFSNGVSGTIVKLGWMETVLRCSDEVMMSIPNEDLLKQRVMNLSRVRLCQVKQKVNFKMGDVDKVPELIQEIKDQIETLCPALVKDGTRPFRVHWTDFGSGKLEITVDTHFRIRPIGDEYWNNRQRVLQAIDNAVKKVDVAYA